jgi:hypothetical protein
MASRGRVVKPAAKKSGGLSEFVTTRSSYGKRRATVTPLDGPAKRYHSAPPAHRKAPIDASVSGPATQGDLDTWDADPYIQVQD